MINRDYLVDYLDEFLDCASFADYAPNGLQIEGRKQITNICTAVSAGQEVIEHAISGDVDLLLVHHGYFWKGESQVICGPKKSKFKLILENNLNLCAYHLPLDANLNLGNNACLAKIFAVSKIKSHSVGGIRDILWSGELQKPLSVAAFSSFLEAKIQKPLHLPASIDEIHKIAWCSGAAQDFIEDAYKLKVDAYISGEVSERTFYQAKELGIHYFACGHHATERYGIQALGEHLASKFDLNHKFIDTNNPV